MELNFPWKKFILKLNSLTTFYFVRIIIIYTRLDNPFKLMEPMELQFARLPLHNNGMVLKNI